MCIQKCKQTCLPASWPCNSNDPIAQWLEKILQVVE